MTITGVEKFLLLFFVISGSRALQWSNIHEIDGDFYKNSYEIQEVKSTRELDFLMEDNSDYFYFYKYGNSRHQYKQSVEKIVIGQNSTLNSIPTKVFEKFANLAEFAAIDVFLEEINRDDFESAKNLYYLVLSSNQIKRLENMVFMHCKKLVEVDLSSNEISFIHDHAFEGMSSGIKKIDLSNNKITFLKEDSLIYLLKGVTFSTEDVTLNFTGNQIEEIAPSNKTAANNFPPVYLVLINNELKAFECTTIKFSFLDLENNEIKSLNAKSSFVQLDVSNNKLSQLFIAKNVNFVKGLNNQLKNITIEDESQLDTLILSGNKLGNDFLPQLKDLKRLQMLKLSDTNLTKLNIDTFANLELLETLQLDHNKISSIGYGVFAHQANLVNLNISYNELKSIDLHVFGALSSLEQIDISGNKILSLEDYESIHQILPKLSTIGLEDNFWSCSYLSKIRNSLRSQNITIDSPRRRVKNETNFDGFACFENSDFTSPVGINIDHIFSSNVTSDAKKLVDLKPENTRIKLELEQLSSIILQLKKEILELKSSHLSSQISNATDINEVRSIVEQMNNVTLEKQKLAYDQPLQKINAAIENLKTDARKNESFKSAIIAPSSNFKPGLSRLELFLIVFLLFSIAFLIILAVHRTKRYVNKKIDQITRLRVSRRNSISTVVTYDNSNNV